MIRKYQDKDLTNVLEVWYQASLIAHPFLEDAFLAKERANIENIYMPKTETWVYEKNNSVTGFISMMGNEVGAIFVHPSFQGKGIGKLLMDHVAKIYDELEVEVFEKNKIGRSFYKKYGFEFMHQSIHEQTGQVILRLKYKTL